MADFITDDGPVIEAEFVLEPADYPFVRAADQQSCTFELAGIFPRTGERYAEFFNVTDADPATVAATAAEHDGVEARYLRAYDSGGILEFVVSGDCPTFTLAQLGALPREIEGDGNEGRLVVEISSHYDQSAVIESFLTAYPEATLTTKRERESVKPLFTESTFQQVVTTRLTDRQQEVLRTAYDAGYYEWPRECTGEELADELGISSATFAEHIAAAERKLLTVTFEGPE